MPANPGEAHPGGRMNTMDGRSPHTASMLDAPVNTLPGIGPRIAERLARLGIVQLRDALFHLPHRYMDRTRLMTISALIPGHTALCQGTVESVQISYGRRRSLLCRINDGTGVMQLRFFHFSKAQQQKLVQGQTLRCWGQVRTGSRSLEIIHPEYQRIDETTDTAVEQTLTPVYPLTKGLSQFRLRQLSQQALTALDNDPTALTELLPPALLRQFALSGLVDALRFAHRPPPDADTEELEQGKHPTQIRLVFEELLAHHLSLRLVRAQARQRASFPLNDTDNTYLREFLRQLPFKLTKAQQKALSEIKKDMFQATPMLRLLQGDVGSGKTVVAAITALMVIQSGYQAALMAPTEVLAEQHYFNLKQWFSTVGVPVMLLTGKQNKKEKEQALNALNTAQALIAIGTHALFQEQVAFGSVGLVIIDEQQRFGVDQRLALLEKGGAGSKAPHQLIMTATPIPRTLAMTLFADLDLSVIDELPPGRQPVRTTVISNEKRDQVIRRINAVCKAGQQVYWVCALIENSAVLQLEAAEEVQKYLTRELTELHIGLIHGRMKSAEKEAVMNDFKRGGIDLLVATTVIEVGVDVPNASLMIIENAERLGLAQLHQLRGRVGRGRQLSNCVLLYQPPLSETARIRLNRMRETNDGFAIARSDLELRGPGEILGRKQTGAPELRIADLARHGWLLPQVQQAADIIMNRYPALPGKLVNRWLTTKVDFGKV